MLTRMFSPLSAALLFLGMGQVALAAPPVLEYLHPAGLQANTEATITAAGKVEPWPPEVWVSHSNVQVVPDKKKGTLNVTVKDSGPTVCWIRLYNAEGASAPRPLIIGTLPEVAEKEPNNEPAKATKIDTLPVIVNGRLDSGADVDTFAVSMTKGQTLVASLQANRTLGSPMDGVMQIVSADGFVLEQNDDDQGLDPQIAFTAPADGTYLVRLFAFPATPNSSITLSSAANYVYRLTLTTGAYIDHALPLAVTAGEPAVVQLFGWNIPDATQFTLPPQEAGAEAVITDVSHSNSLPLAVVPHPSVVESESNSRETPQEITAPVTLTGRISAPGEEDVYRITAKKGERLSIRVESRALGYPLDPVLVIRDAQGKTLARVDDVQQQTDPEHVQSISADGEYRICVTDLFSRGGWRFAYRLTVTLAKPDYALTLAADSFTLKPGTPLEIPVTIDRKLGFNGEIEITAEGVPEGVTVTPVKSEAKGGSAKAVKLVLNGGTEAWNGPIRIVGKSGDESPLTHAATYIPTGLTATLTNPWLTVLKP